MAGNPKIEQCDREAAVSIAYLLGWSSTICFDVLNGTCEYVHARYPIEYVEQVRVLEMFAQRRVIERKRIADLIRAQPDNGISYQTLWRIADMIEKGE